MNIEDNVEEYLKKRLLIDENQNISTKFDELVSQIQMLLRLKCKEQRLNCLFGLDLNYMEDNIHFSSVKPESIINAKEPNI